MGRLITAIIFSRDRPAQCSLLLQSLRRGPGPHLFPKIIVLYKATDGNYQEGYDYAHDYWGAVTWIPEGNFCNDVYDILGTAERHVCFLTDDDVFYRFRCVSPLPGDALDKDPDLLTVSLRLGENTTYCYPMRSEQYFPTTTARSDLHTYMWRGASHDFGYPASLDGNVWRTSDLDYLIGNRRFVNPNELEDVLVTRCKSAGRPLMACYRESSIVNIPANRVNVTHRGNRYGEEFPADEKELNRKFLCGEMLSLSKMDFGDVNAAHCERELVFND